MAGLGLQDYQLRSAARKRYNLVLIGWKATGQEIYEGAVETVPSGFGEKEVS
jgi:hypothetical protein